MLVAFRLAQGAFGALLIPQGLGIMRAIFPKDELPKAFALFGPVIGGAAVLGPIIGGLLVGVHSLGGWRLIFFVNLPLGTAAAIGAALLMPEVRAPVRPRIDLLGSAIVCVAMLALVYPLIEGRQAAGPRGRSHRSLGGAVLLAVFAVQQVLRTRAGKDGLIQPSLFRNRGYNSGTLVLFVFFLGMTGVLFVLTLFLQIGQGFSALHAGLTFVPWSLGLAVGAGLSGGLLANRYGRHVLEAGGGVSVVGLLLLILESRSGLVSTWDIVPGLLVMGLGMGLMVAPLFGHHHRGRRRRRGRFGVGRAERGPATCLGGWRRVARDGVLRRAGSRRLSSRARPDALARPGADGTRDRPDAVDADARPA